MFNAYSEIWDVYNSEGGEELLGLTSEEQARQITHVLAHTDEPGREVNCMGLLECVRPRLHEFIRRWTGSEFSDIRAVQEGRLVCAELYKLIEGFMQDVHFLPAYAGRFCHYSKDFSWARRYNVGDILELKSFMGCASEGSDFVHASDPKIFFTPSSQVCYLGSLTTTPPEREVLILPGSTFKILRNEGGAIYVCDNV